MKRMLDVLRPKIENQFKTWSTCIPDGRNAVPGEQLGEVTVMLRAKYKSYLQAVVEKLAENVGITFKLFIVCSKVFFSDIIFQKFGELWRENTSQTQRGKNWSWNTSTAKLEVG